MLPDIGWILKIAGVGITVAIVCQILSKTGREEQAMLVSLAGVVAVFWMLISQIAELFETVRTVFGL